MSQQNVGTHYQPKVLPLLIALFFVFEGGLFYFALEQTSVPVGKYFRFFINRFRDPDTYFLAGAFFFILQLSPIRLIKSKGLLVGHVVSLVGFIAISYLRWAHRSETSPFLMFPWRLCGVLSFFLLFASRLANNTPRWFFHIALSIVFSSITWDLYDTLAPMAWKLFGHGTMSTSCFVLMPFVSNGICDVSAGVIGSASFSARILYPCSGVEGIGLIVLLLTLTCYLFRDNLRLRRALILFPVGVFGAWSLNVLRIVALILVGTHVSKEAADTGFHAHAGTLAFTGLSLIFMATLAGSSYFNRNPIPLKTLVCSPTFLFLAPFVLATTIGIATRSIDIRDWLYPVRIIPAGILALWAYRIIGLPERIPARRMTIWAGVVTGTVWIIILGMGSFQIRDLASISPWADWRQFVWVAIRLIGYTVMTPIMEELAFRGYLMRRISRFDFEKMPLDQVTFAGIVISSLAFGSLHSNWILASVTGVGFALVVKYTRSLTQGIVVHMATNGSIALAGILTDRWELLG